MKKYTETHEWINVENGIGTIGITQYAQQELGTIVYIELPEEGKAIKAGEEAAVLESTKAAADVYSPVSGTIHKVNKSLKDDSELVNRSSEGEGWIFQVKLSNPEELKALKDKE